MKTKIFFLAGALFVTLFVSAQKKQMTLQECIDIALQNNRNIKQKEITKKSNEIAYSQSKLNLLPNLNGSASQGWSFGRSQLADGTYQNINSSSTSYGLSGGITIFDGLRLKYNIDAKLADLKASEADLQLIQRDMIMSVSTAFLNVLLDKELLQVATDQLTLTKSKIEQQKSLVKAGKLAEGEIYELLAQEAKEEQSKIKADNALSQAYLELSQILEMDSSENFDIVIPENLVESELKLLNPNLVYDSAVVNRPDIKSAEYRLKSSERNVDIAKSYFYPTLDFGANIGGGFYNSVNVPLNTKVGFDLRIPIFNKFETKNQVKAAKLNVESNRLNLENSKIELRKTVQQAYYNAIAAKARWDAASKSEIASREAFRFVNQKNEAGRATVYELYQAKNNLTQVLSEVAQAKYEYVFRIKILEWLK
ncbi:MAG TPA: TolC family protein [Paludibacter sp.]|nr:TolC family protein [Paludibacter sp.]